MRSRLLDAKAKASLRSREIQRLLERRWQDESIRHKASTFGVAFLFFSFVVWSCWVDTPLYSKDVDPLFLTRDDYRPLDTSRVRTRDAVDFFANVRPVLTVETRFDVCPFIISSSTKPSPSWLWLAHELSRPDKDWRKGQATIAPPTLLWRSGGALDYRSEDVNTGFITDLVSSAKLRSIRLEEGIDFVKQKSSDHVKAWEACSLLKAQCTYCLVIEDTIHVVDHNLKRGLYEILVLGDRNALDWGLIKLLPAERLSISWMIRLFMIFLSVMAYNVGLNQLGTARVRTHGVLQVALITVVVVLTFYTPTPKLNPPRMVPNVPSISTPFTVYLVKSRDAQNLNTPWNDLPVPNNAVRYFRLLRGRADLQIITSSLEALTL